MPRGPRLPAIQSPTTGSAVFHMLKAGSSVRATPSTTTMVFCSRTSSGRVCHVEQFGHLEQQRQQLGHRDGFGRLAVDRLADGADRLGEGRDIVLARHIAGLEMHLGDAQIVAGDEAVEDFGEEAALLLAEPPGDAEIDGDDGAVRLDEQIARMHVGMEEAVAQRMAQERLDQVGGDRLAGRGRRRAGLRHRSS